MGLVFLFLIKNSTKKCVYDVVCFTLQDIEEHEMDSSPSFEIAAFQKNDKCKIISCFFPHVCAGNPTYKECSAKKKMVKNRGHLFLQLQSFDFFFYLNRWQIHTIHRGTDQFLCLPPSMHFNYTPNINPEASVYCIKS